MLFSKKHIGLYCSILILLIYFSINLYFENPYMYSAYYAFDYNGYLKPLIKLLSSQMMIEFVIGMMVCEITLKVKSNLHIKNTRVLYILNTFFLMISIVMIVSPPIYGHGLFNVGVGTFLLFLSSVIYEIIGEVKKVKLLIFLGDISYSLYISHLLVFNLINKENGFFVYINKMNGFSKLLFLTIVSVLFAYIIHLLIETKSARLGRRILKNKTIIKNG
ncbi:acyltransferase [Xenorhabdus sp. Reich]|uniref:Acyltransferase n=1 Tax=Xenorhabdus littoralis TaxID=2582835 RepID=A0ABU4SJU3_9GAMM|nr:acyltransferase [Xenorhabdus sp. Reich]